MEEQDLLAVTIGKNLTRLRKMANLTQLELAEKLNYSDKSVSKWEQGNGIPDVRILIQLADYTAFRWMIWCANSSKLK